ncbi:MAG TPA: single-stranded DNA-binding protein [Bacteroidales bacterium]|nr:single-stranded DNA-binding protein [Bacteroidales bacterium]HPT02352.1 single-stranded DNA-binding protein [Bacteroidales bacterium]
MNTLRNSVQLIGRLGQDPEIRTLENGAKVANFRFATDDSYNDKDGNRKEQTEWHNIVAWGNLAERCEKYLKKGKEVVISGRLTYRNWEDKNNSKHTTAEIVVNEMLFVGSKPEEESK